MSKRIREKLESILNIAGLSSAYIIAVLYVMLIYMSDGKVKKKTVVILCNMNILGSDFGRKTRFNLDHRNDTFLLTLSVKLNAVPVDINN